MRATARPLIGLLIVGASMFACSGTTSTFNLTSADVDPTYTCAVGANNAAYDLHANVQTHNATSGAVTIKSVTADMTLDAVKGSWQERIGDKYDAGAAKFTPASIGQGATTTLKVTISSACTNAKASNGESYGEYRVTIHVTTSAGSFSISSKNLHRLIAA
jgi:hypothetical protein